MPKQFPHPTIQNYHDAFAWLLSLIRDPQGKRFTIEKSTQTRLAEMRERIPRMSDFLAFAGNPQRRFRSVHVAGTSGKGSVAKMIAALLAASGQRTGDHVSPYVQLCNEKLMIDGHMIAPPNSPPWSASSGNCTNNGWPPDAATIT